MAVTALQATAIDTALGDVIGDLSADKRARRRGKASDADLADLKVLTAAAVVASGGGPSTVTSINPTEAEELTATAGVVATGTNLALVTGVKMGGVAATSVVATSTTVTFTTPATVAAGVVDVQFTSDPLLVAGNLTKTDFFEFTEA